MADGVNRASPSVSPAGRASSAAGGEGRQGWNVPVPETLPRPTPWPAAAALGIVFILWGVVTAYLIAGVGVLLLGTAVVGWITELRHER